MVTVILLCALCDVCVQAKIKDVKISTGYTVSKLKVPVKYKDSRYGYKLDEKSNEFAKTKNGLVLVNTLYKNNTNGNSSVRYYITSWNSNGKNKSVELQSGPCQGLECDDKGDIAYVYYHPKKNKTTSFGIYKCDKAGNVKFEIKVSKLMKHFLSREERDNKYLSAGIIDYEIRGRYADVLLEEYRMDHQYNRVYSIQTFDMKKNKRVNAYKLYYKFDSIVNGKLYGYTDEGDRETYEYKAPIEEGYYKYSKDGKKCLWKYECSDVAWRYDIAGSHIIFLNENGIFSLDTNKESQPELLVDSNEYSKLKKTGHYSQVIAINKDEIYLPYQSYTDDSQSDVRYVIKIKR